MATGVEDQGSYAEACLQMRPSIQGWISIPPCQNPRSSRWLGWIGDSALRAD